MIHREEIAYTKGYRSTKNGEVIGLLGYELMLPISKSSGRKYFYASYCGRTISIRYID